MQSKIIKSILVFAVFITPLFYLPFTQDMFSFNKEMLFSILVLIASVLWFGKSVRDKTVTVIRTPLDIPLLLFVVVYGLATVFSGDRGASLLGINSAGLPSFLTIVALTLFYFISVNVFAETKQAATASRVFSTQARGSFVGAQILLIGLLASSLVAQLIAYTSWFKMLFLSGQHESFTTLGSSSALALLVAASLPIAVYFLLKKSSRIFVPLTASAYIIISLLTLNTINYSIGWIVAAVGSFVFLVFYTAYYNQIESRMNLAWTAAFVLAISLVASMMKPPSLLMTFMPASYRPAIPSEVSLGTRVSRQIAVASSVADPISFIFGKGPHNFSYVFSQERPEGFNYNQLWQVRFGTAGNVFYEMIATIGWLGFIAFLVLCAFYVVSASFLLRKMRHNAGETTRKGDVLLLTSVISVFAAMLVALYLRMPQITGFLLIWIVLAVTAILVIADDPKKFATITFDFHSSAKSALSLSFGLVFIFVVLLFFGVYLGRVYLAEFYYAQAVVQVQNAGDNTEELNKAVLGIGRAIDLHPASPQYYLTVAEVQLALAQLELTQKSESNVDTTQLTNYLGAAINVSKIALDYKPQAVGMWQNRGRIFELVSPFAREAREFAIQSYTRATELEPTNAMLWYSVGENQRLFSLEQKQKEEQEKDKSDQAKEGEDAGLFDVTVLSEAKINLGKAIALKADYFAPYLSLARIAENENDLATAVDRLTTALSYPQNQTPSTLYELARLIYNKELLSSVNQNKDTLLQIRSLLNQAVAGSPDFANALYMRALVQKQLGNIADAVADMERVVELNPESTEAREKLGELRRLFVNVSVTLPPAESSEEIEPDLEFDPGVEEGE